MGQVTHVSAQLGEIRQREFRLELTISIAAHIGLLVLLLFRPTPSAVSLPGVVSVELVAAPPAPAAAPAPVAVPPPPVAKKVVLPAQPKTPKPKPKEVAKKLVEKPPPPERIEQDYSDVLEQLRTAAGEEAPTPVEQPQPQPQPAPLATGTAGGRGQLASPEVVAWVKQAKIHVRRAWILPPGFRSQSLEAHVLVDLDAAGNVIGTPEIVRRSGNPWYDEGVVRAIRKASPLPPPPAADEWAFVFVPGDSF